MVLTTFGHLRFFEEIDILQQNAFFQNINILHKTSGTNTEPCKKPQIFWFPCHIKIWDHQDHYKANLCLYTNATAIV